MKFEQLGPYEIRKTIGKGGMGAVYEAVDTATGDRVAVKALNPQLAQTEGFRERFEAEIDSLKALRHEGIVRLYGYGEENGVLFYSMELVDGTSLEEELRAGRRFDWREVADISIQLCRALKHAHDHGVVHRDIKPANILVDSSNRVKLADFGIARLFGNTQLTTAGGVLGTADYMSPEQADGKPVTDRCDQYSLGGVMYALLAGRTPFRSKSLPKMLQLQRFAEPEPVRRYAPETPEQLESTILQLLAKNPEDRFRNMIVLSRHLEAMVRALSRPAADDFSVDHDLPSESFRGAGEDVDSLAPTRADLSSDFDVMPGDLKSESSWKKTDEESARESLLPEREVPADAQTMNATSEDDVSEATAPPGGPSTTTSLAETSADSDRSTFTMVPPDDHWKKSGEPSAWRQVLSQLLPLFVLLAGAVLIALYLRQPKSADELFAAIESANKTPDSVKLDDLEKQVDEFLERFSADSRKEQVQDFFQQAKRDELKRRIERQARLERGPYKRLLPVEQLYLQAVALAKDNPERAASQMKAIVDLYGAAPPKTESTNTGDGQIDELEQRQSVCLELAAEQFDSLRKVVDRSAAEKIPDLTERLARAEQLMREDPEQANAICSAIVELYGDQLWATEVVAKAKQLLDDQLQ